MFRRHHFIASLVVIGVSTSLSACADDEVATPRVVIDSQISPGAGRSNKECPETGTWIQIGSFGNPAAGRVDENNPESPLKDPPRPVDDGGEEITLGGRVAVTCSVIPREDGFDVAATAQLNGAGTASGLLKITGFFKPGQTNEPIDIIMSRDGRAYKQANCKTSFVGPLQTVAAGRVWAEVECDTSEYEQGQRTCNTKAQFRFENCGQ
ncbi:MAG: hypothetical protein KF819_24990 [Labilithrix sp.]|nr:hypothetical protein [Labilithrix sp.]